ncbi:hypothetical protein BJP27_24095 (plasmid) [Pseudomonas oryzihabitans]|nr:hypothetical protein BJP27_24095 [Pseudomonas psychrotolerans]
MTQVSFTRARPVYRSGVQLLELVDNSQRAAASDSDQTCATVGRFTRGRIDQAFLVDSGNRVRSLGASASLQVSALNEAHLQAYEMLDRGATGVVVSRLVPAAAVLKYLVATQDATTKAIAWTVETSVPAGCIVAIKHLECFNDGVKIGIHAVENPDGNGVNQDTSLIKVRLYDVQSGDMLFDDFAGSLLVDAIDEFGQSSYLPTVASGLTDLVEFTTKGTAVSATSNCYGLDADEAEKWVYATLKYFDEGGTIYANADYDAAMDRLYNSDAAFGYLHAGGTQNVALIAKLDRLSVKMNKVLAFDVPSSLTSVTAAVAFMNNLGLDNHYPVAYWAPLTCDDPLNGGKARWGASGVQLGLRCRRNAQTDGNGVAPKQYAVAGSDYNLGRTGVKQVLKFSDNDMEKLAKAKINLVGFETYSSGGRYTFLDSLTCSKSLGDKRLATVAEMSAFIDDFVTAYGKECLQKPIDVAITNLSKAIEIAFKAFADAKWFTPSDEMNGASWVATIKPNAQSPKEKIDVRYSISYQGTTRVITVGQTLSR